jgi:hypothetical protein
MQNNKKTFVINALRRASYRWYGRYNALKEAKVARNQYKCPMCPEGTLHPKKNIQIDHKDPIVPVSGWDSWEGLIDRLFCDTSGFQILCLEHHKAKSNAENEQRRLNKPDTEEKPKRKRATKKD